MILQTGAIIAKPCDDENEINSALLSIKLTIFVEKREIKVTKKNPNLKREEEGLGRDVRGKRNL